MIAKMNEFLIMYEKYKGERASTPTKEDFLLEVIKIYYDSTTKRDKKRSSKLILDNKERLRDYDFWKFIDEEELESRLS